MSKRLTGIKGQATRNVGPRNKRYKNWIARLRLAESTAEAANSVDALMKIRQLYFSAKRSATKFVPRGSSKMLASLIRQRT